MKFSSTCIAGFVASPGIVVLLAALVPGVQSSQIAADEFTRDEVKFFARMSASIRSGNKMLDAPEPDLIALHEFAEKGPEDLRKAAELELMGWAIAAVNSERAAAAWKVAAAEGRPELYAKWAKDGEHYLAEHHKDDFPFSVSGISQLRPGGGGFLEAVQMKRQVQLRLLAVLNQLKTDRLSLLGAAFLKRAETRKQPVMDPAKDSSLNAELTASDGFSLMARLTNRGKTSLTNAVVISVMQVHPVEPAIPEGAVLMTGLNGLISNVTGIGGGDDDLYAANLVLDQWNWGRDQFSMVFLPELKPREQIAFAIGQTSSAEYAGRAGIIIYCQEFHLPEMPILGLGDWQKANVAAMKRRGATWMNGETPKVMADLGYEADFVKARRTRSK